MEFLEQEIGEPISVEFNEIRLAWSVVNQYREAAANVKIINRYIKEDLEYDMACFIGPVQSYLDPDEEVTRMVFSNTETAVLKREAHLSNVNRAFDKAKRRKRYFAEAVSSLAALDQTIFLSIPSSRNAITLNDNEKKVVKKVCSFLEKKKDQDVFEEIGEEINTRGRILFR